MDKLIIKGARQNNLKNISLTLPHNKLITFTGISGSGKSSLAFDTIFAEGQWRFIESLSTYARLFLEKLDRPDVDSIQNIRPAIALEQRNTVKTSRSTVGTMTEISDYLRLLFSKIAQPHCPVCGDALKSWSPSSVVQELLEKYNGEKALIIFQTKRPVQELQKEGFHRVLIDGKITELASLDTKQNTLDIVLDRLIIKDEPRLSDSIETAWQHGGSNVKIVIVKSEEENMPLLFSSALKCHKCDIEVARPQPLLFSFNHPLGACPECKGFGNTLKYSEGSIIPDKDLSLEEGAIDPWNKPSYIWWYEQFAKKAKKAGIRLDMPYKDLPQESKALIFEGSKDFYGINDFFAELENKRYKLHVRVFLTRYREAVQCGNCGGSKLSREALAFTIGGLNIAQISDMPILNLREFIAGLTFSKYEEEVTGEIIRQIRQKLDFLIRVGVEYLTINRLTKTLSGGESQRINLANQLASKLTGTLYVLDEPTVGLHARDVKKIADILIELAEIGNTVITVEHDKSIIESSDWVVELGPGGGEKGGRLIFTGTVADFLKSDTLTATYIKETGIIPAPKSRRMSSGNFLTIKNASGNNLKDINISIPLQRFTCVTGVSGSGKSTLIDKTLYRALANAFKESFETPEPFESIHGIEHLKGVRIIDQQPIGKSPRSNPVTYIKGFDHIRKIFADEQAAKNLGFGPGHFSFNAEEGRCSACKGVGYQKLEMYFFEDLYITCEECKGKRFRPEILNITYNGKNIHEALNLTVDEAVKFFNRVPSLLKKLELMSSVGLGYLRLGQPVTTLSGGESQRLKICAELGAGSRTDYLYILDEPTVGLHPEDITKLLKVIDHLLSAGNTVVIVEHNLDVIKCADWIIDLGPEGGEKGGYIVAEGRPEDIAKDKKSHTGRYLKEHLKRANHK
ncbi:MAG: excinuclease ABC subunit UvrA [Thermodesulfovibrionia bacterium]|nr:excinuclease ABC subunit UvrA [Thermodesulfovibrionia bacterium]